MRYSFVLGNLGNTRDRFLSSGYKDQPSKEEMIRKAAAIQGITGVELVGNWDITEATIGEMKRLLSDVGLAVASIIPDHFSQKRWGRGAFTSRDASIRRQAVETTCEMMDVAHEMGCDLINLWPGQDGYDYYFQGQFDCARDLFIDGVRRCADHRADVRIALEYKVKEPRTHSYLARGADTLLLSLEVDRPNVGVCIDTGHTLMGAENLAEVASLLMRHRKLFHLHCNDNYRTWDDDMIVGSVNLLDFLELFHWLHHFGYAGWFSMDQYPYREDGSGAITASVRWVDGMWRKMEAFGWDRFSALVSNGDPVETSRVMREFFGIELLSGGEAPPTPRGA